MTGKEHEKRLGSRKYFIYLLRWWLQSSSNLKSVHFIAGRISFIMQRFQNVLLGNKMYY